MEEKDKKSLINQAYTVGYKRDELLDFTAHVLAHPKRYRRKTLQRAKAFRTHTLGSKE